MKELQFIKNKQKSTEKVFWILTLVFIIVMLMPFFKGNPLSDIWPLAFTGIFLSIAFFITALIFRGRAKKMERLKSGEKLLVHLELNDEMLRQYASTMKKESKQKSKAVMWIVFILFVVITVPFLFILEDDEVGVFLAIIASVFFIVLAASLYFPGYYYRKNLKGDKQILIGEKYAYFNGYLHNWDYPLSGLTTAKSIKTPFRGIHLAYYYTDRTLRHVQEIKIPIPNGFDPEPVLAQLRTANGK